MIHFHHARNIPAIVLAIGLATGTVSAATPTELFDQLYGKQFETARSTADTADDLALARELLGAARQSDEPATIVVLTEKVYELIGTNADGLALAVEAMELQARASEADAPKARERLIELLPRHYSASTGEQKREAGTLLVDLLLAQVDQRIADERIDEAQMLARRALAISAGLSDEKNAEAKAAFDRVTALRRTFLKIDAVKRRIAGSPHNRQLYDQLALLYLVELDSPDKATALGEKLSPAMAKRLEPLSKTADDRSITELLDLGQWYGQDLYREAGAEARPTMLEHAMVQYETILNRSDVAELTRIKSQTAYDRLAERLSKLTGGTTATGGDWIDLLPKIDTAKQTAAGTWKMAGKQLVGSGELAALHLPVKGQSFYRIRLRATRTNGKGLIGLILPVGDRHVLAFLGQSGGLAGLSMVDGKFPATNGTGVKLGNLPEGVAFRVETTVDVDDTKASITMSINGKRVINWSGPTSKLSLSDLFEKTKPGGNVTLTLQKSTVTVSELAWSGRRTP